MKNILTVDSTPYIVNGYCLISFYYSRNFIKTWGDTYVKNRVSVFDVTFKTWVFLHKKTRSRTLVLARTATSRTEVVGCTNYCGSLVLRIKEQFFRGSQHYIREIRPKTKYTKRRTIHASELFSLFSHGINKKRMGKQQEWLPLCHNHS